MLPTTCGVATFVGIRTNAQSENDIGKISLRMRHDEDKDVRNVSQQLQKSLINVYNWYFYHTDDRCVNKRRLSVISVMRTAEGTWSLHCLGVNSSVR